MSKQFKPTKIIHTLVESELQCVQILGKIVKKTQKKVIKIWKNRSSE